MPKSKRMEKREKEAEEASRELTAAIEKAAASRDISDVATPLFRAKRADLVEPELIARAEKLKAEIDAEKKAEIERLRRVAEEKAAAAAALSAPPSGGKKKGGGGLFGGKKKAALGDLEC